MWGEITTTPVSELSKPDLSLIMEQSRNKDCLSMYNIPGFISDTRDIHLPPMDSCMIKTAELNRRINNMENIIEEAELAVKYNVVMQSDMPPLSISTDSLKSTTPPTDTNELKCETNIFEESKSNVIQPNTTKNKRSKHKIFPRRPMNFVDKEYSFFSMGFGKNPSNLSEATRRQIEAKCVATMLAHIGFGTTNQNVVEVLTDVLEEFMKNICTQLRHANDAQLTGESNGFSDIVEKVFIQSGLGGIRGVGDYYEKRIKRYECLVKDRFKNVSEHYQSLLGPVNMRKEAVIESIEEMDCQDVPEVHFTAMDGEKGYLQPFLESGFQMLNSLEKEQYVT